MRVLFLEVDTESTWAVSSIGPSFLASFLRARGHEAIFRRIPLAMSNAEVVETVRALAPGLVGLSLTTRQWLRGRAVVQAIRAAIDVPVIAGGLHPTFSGEEVLASEGFDYVCLGEGEEPLAELVAMLERGERHPIANIWFRGGPRPLLRKPFEPLDALPFMARDFLDEKWGCIHMTTQRGCPFPCTYCAARKYEDLYEGVGEYGRRRSHESVIRELEGISPLNYVIFLDDTFTIHHPWVKEFCKLYGERFKIPFSVHARVETVDKQLLALMASAGCKHVVYGVESGSLRVRREIMQRPVTNDRMKQVFAWTREAGMITTANYMLGLPGETREDLDATLALHEELKPDDFGYFVFYPYPGTALFHLCKEKGYLPENYLELPANHRQSILRLPDLSQEEIASAYDRFTEARRRAAEARLGGQLDAAARATVAETIRHGAATS